MKRVLQGIWAAVGAGVFLLLPQLYTLIQVVTHNERLKEAILSGMAGG